MENELHLEIQEALAGIQANILRLLSTHSFTSELSGEDELMLGTFLDFVCRLDDDHYNKNFGQFVEESPEMWREQQDAETD